MKRAKILTFNSIFLQTKDRAFRICLVYFQRNTFIFCEKGFSNELLCIISFSP